MEMSDSTEGKPRSFTVRVTEDLYRRVNMARAKDGKKIQSLLEDFLTYYADENCRATLENQAQTAGGKKKLAGK